MTDPANGMARLVILSSDRAPVPLDRTFTFGRSELHADVSIDDKRLSRKHCEFIRRGDQILVRDLGSANGVRINGEMIQQEKPLSIGDEISLGGLKLRVEADPEVAQSRRTTGTFNHKNPSSPSISTAEEPEAEDADEESVLELESDIDLEAEDDPEPPLPPPVEDPAKPLAILKVVRGDLPLPFYRIEKLPFIVGRNPGCDLVLVDDRMASNKHAVFERGDGEGIVVSDVNSTNGTKVEGTNIDSFTLAGGERVQIGGQMFRFHYSLEDQQEDSDSALELLDDAPDINIDAVEDIGDTSEALTEESLREDIAHIKALERAEVNTKGSSSLRKVVVALEILLALILLAAIGGAVVMLNDGAKDLGDNTDAGRHGPTPIKPPSLLTGTWRSFEASQAGAFDLPNWRSHESASIDELIPVEESAVGGSQALRLTRFLPETRSSSRRSVLVCKQFIDVSQLEAISTSFHARLREGAPSMFFTVHWFESDDAATAFREDVLNFHTPSSEWSVQQAIFPVPALATFARVGLGLSGAGGQAEVDEYAVQPADAQFQQELGTTMTLTHGGGGEFRLGVGGRQFLPALSFGFGSRDGTQHLDHRRWLHRAPVLTDLDGIQKLRYEVFDPDRSIIRPVELQVAGDTLEAVTLSDEGGLYANLTLHASLADDVQPEGMVSLRDQHILAQGRHLTSVQAYDLRAAGQRNTVRLSSGSTADLQASRLDLKSSGSTVRLTVMVDKTQQTEFERLLALTSDTAAALNLRVEAALELIRQYPADFDGIEQASNVIVGVTSHFRVRHHELNALIEDADSAMLDPDVFVRAAAATAGLRDQVVALHSGIASKAGPVERLLQESVSLTPLQRSALTSIIQSLSQLGQLRQAFESLTGKGDDRAFALISRRQSVQAAPLLSSAEDHLANGELVQTQLKLVSLLREFPSSTQSARARSYLIDLARGLLEQVAKSREEGLATIARESELKAQSIINLILATSPAADTSKLELMRRRLLLSGWLSEAQVSDWIFEETRIYNEAKAMAQP